jgi:hypothetical protein
MEKLGGEIDAHCTAIYLGKKRRLKMYSHTLSVTYVLNRLVIICSVVLT